MNSLQEEILRILITMDKEKIQMLKNKHKKNKKLVVWQQEEWEEILEEWEEEWQLVEWLEEACHQFNNLHLCHLQH